MAIVSFHEYRQHDLANTEANNAIMALLAGAHLAAHTLQLTEGSTRLLPEMFPHVPHIQRFNLTTPAARGLLADAEAHLGSMAVPYVLAIHEGFVHACLRLIGDTGTFKASQMHNGIARRLPVNFGADLSGFHLARILRNCVIHNGGRVTERSVTELQRDVDPTHIARWTRITRRSPLKLRAGDVVELAHGEVVATMATTRQIARTLNEAMQPALPRATWARLLVDDVTVNEPGHLTDQHNLRKCSGYARHLYGPLALTTQEISTALLEAGHQPRT